jgi:hypothetical protein
MAVIRIAMLIVPLVWAWKREGPLAYTAGWVIIIYFVEIAASGLIEIVVERVRGSRSEG